LSIRIVAQLAQQIGGMRDIGRVRVKAVNILDDQVTGPQGADENHIVFAFGGKTNVVGECRGYMQIDAAAARFPAQEVGFHLDIAIAEQNRIDTSAGGVEVVETISSADRPVGSRSLLQFTPVALEHFGGVAAVLGGKLRADGSQFLLRRLFGQYLARQQFHDGAFDDIAQIRRRLVRLRNQRRHGIVIFGDAPRLGEIIDQRADIVIGGQSHMADRVDDQGAILANGQLMNKARAAQDHTCL
jgi:hypothetical protein